VASGIRKKRNQNRSCSISSTCRTILRGNHTFTANEPDGDPITWSGFAFHSYTPAYGGGGPGPAHSATFNPLNQEFSWNSHASPRGIYEWRVSATDKDGSDEGSLTVHLIEVPEPATVSLFGLAIIGLLKSYRRRRFRLHSFSAKRLD
jgi:hypothetical protein